MNMNEGLTRAVNEQPKKGKTYGYIRVSSDKQTVENQRFEIKNPSTNPSTPYATHHIRKQLRRQRLRIG